MMAIWRGSFCRSSFSNNCDISCNERSKDIEITAIKAQNQGKGNGKIGGERTAKM
jgi:hypothetical protein